MAKKEFVINADNFNSLAGFYDEVEKVLTKGLDWKIGRNLDAFNDVLRGDFGAFAYEEPIILIWKNSEKSKTDLGYHKTIKALEKRLLECHLSNAPSVKLKLENAKKHTGPTAFDWFIEIIQEHKHITLLLK